MGLLIWDKSPEEALVLVINEFNTFSAHNNLSKDESKSMTAFDLTDQSECRTAPSDATLCDVGLRRDGFLFSRGSTAWNHVNAGN